eukprot:GHVL01020510.1.p1 GENE.GHVL01020510.1~~GHVL01020510.1.p1  ORF type:complete len:154 (+),score=13.56 GHVL01020510.1:81-542(+)
MKVSSRTEQSVQIVDENAVLNVKNVGNSIVQQKIKKSSTRKALGDIGNTVLTEGIQTTSKQVNITEKVKKIVELVVDDDEEEIICSLDKPNRYVALCAAPYALHITEHMKSQEVPSLFIYICSLFIYCRFIIFYIYIILEFFFFFFFLEFFSI